MYKRYSFFIAAVILLLGTAFGWTEAFAQEPTPSVQVTRRDNLSFTSAGEEELFTIPVEQEGQVFAITAKGNTEGQVSFRLYKPDGAWTWDPGKFGGEWSFNMFPKAEQAGSYRMVAYWDGPLSGSYSIQWSLQAAGSGENPVKPWALASGIGMCAVAFVFVTYAARQKLGGKYIILGGAAWGISVALKFIFALLANQPLYNLLFTTFTDKIAGPLMWVYVGSLTGIFEVGLVYLFLKLTRWGRASWKQALAFGIGFGGVEALLLGLNSLISVGVVLLMPGQFDGATLNAVAQANNLLYSAAPIIERIFVVLVHVFCGTAIFCAINASKPRWFWAAFILKTALDSVAAYAQLNPQNTLGFLWALEGVIVIFGLISLYGTWILSKRYPQVEQAQASLVPPEPQPTGSG